MSSGPRPPPFDTRLSAAPAGPSGRECRGPSAPEASAAAEGPSPASGPAIEHDVARERDRRHGEDDEYETDKCAEADGEWMPVTHARQRKKHVQRGEYDQEHPWDEDGDDLPPQAN